MLAGAQQHVFARSGAGVLVHYWWDPATNQISHDAWGTGLASDPVAVTIGEFQDVWAVDTAGALQHWYSWTPRRPRIPAFRNSRECRAGIEHGHGFA